jgi:hypothetical protein
LIGFDGVARARKFGALHATATAIRRAIKLLDKICRRRRYAYIRTGGKINRKEGGFAAGKKATGSTTCRNEREEKYQRYSRIKKKPKPGQPGDGKQAALMKGGAAALK